MKNIKKIKILLLCYLYVGNSIAENANSMQPIDSESQYQKDLEFVINKIPVIEKQGYVSAREKSSLETRLGRLIEKQLNSLGAKERQASVIRIVGKENYDKIERVLVRQLESSDLSMQGIAIQLLGYPLFSTDASDKIMKFVFNKDQGMQLLAVLSSVYLDIPGSNYLLYNMIQSEILNDFQTTLAIRSLKLSNDSNLVSIAMGLAVTNPGAMTFLEIFPIIRTNPNCDEVLINIFKSNIYYVSGNVTSRTLNDQVKKTAEGTIMEYIFNNPRMFQGDADVRKKILSYAESNDELFVYPLLIMEKSGSEINYFVEMMEDKKTSAYKKQILQKIINRIDQGSRLQ